ncbi:cellulose binding domain-containing protein [Plantactinospora sp. WMMB334]|uniref:cellulose binding domain-containing protein n=1 Tax=Plantactinospora sp. WMMB334 TaxID=3404119 RepID=UPI003B93469C
MHLGGLGATRDPELVRRIGRATAEEVARTGANRTFALLPLRGPRSGGFSANVTIRNTGTSAVAGWTLGFTFPSGGQRVAQGWSARWTQSGAAVTATNGSWNANLAPGASVGIGCTGSHGGSNRRRPAAR